MKIARKLYTFLLLVCVAGNIVGCGSTTNINSHTNQDKGKVKEKVITPNVYYVTMENMLYKLDTKTGDNIQIAENVRNWEMIEDKIYYATNYNHMKEIVEEDSVLSQNELYVMDLDGGNKTKVLGRDQIENSGEITWSYILNYDILGKDQEHVYFNMRKGELGSAWGCNVVYRINTVTNQIEQVSDVLLGAISYFNAVNNHFYYTSAEMGEWGEVVEVNCTTKESTVLTEYGRSVGIYKNEIHYVDMNEYMNAKSYNQLREQILEHSIYCNPFIEHDCIGNINDGNYNQIAQGRFAVPTLYKVNYETGEVEKKREMYFIEEITQDDSVYYSFDMKVEGDYLNISTDIYDSGKVSNKIKKISLGDGREQILDEYGNQEARIALGQTKEKLYYLENAGSHQGYNLICIDMTTNTKEILEKDIRHYKSDIIWKHAQELNESLMKALMQVQGEEVIVYSTDAGIYSVSAEGGEPIKLYGVDEFTNWEVLNKNGQPTVYFSYDGYLYEGNFVGEEPKQIHTNDVISPGIWNVVKDQVTGEEWLVSKGYNGETRFSNLAKFIDVQPMHLEIGNVLVANNRFIYDIKNSEIDAAVEKSIYICDQEGNEKVLIEYPEHLDGKEGATALILGDIQGSEVYYGIGYQEENKGEIYKYDMKTQKNILIQIVELEYDTNMKIEVDEENIYITHAAGSYMSGTIVLNRQSGEYIRKDYNEFEQSIKGTNGDTYIIQEDDKWNVDEYKQTIVKKDGQGEIRPLVEITDFIKKIRYVKK